MQPGSSSKTDEEGKVAKHTDLNDLFMFQPYTVETLGVLGSSSMRFLVGSKMTHKTSDKREMMCLFLRIPLAVLLGNACSVMATSRSLK